MGKHLFCALLCEIRGWKPLSLLKARISISGVYFSAVGTKLDFFNRIGQKLPLNGVYQTRGYSV